MAPYLQTSIHFFKMFVAFHGKCETLDYEIFVTLQHSEYVSYERFITFHHSEYD